MFPFHSKLITSLEQVQNGSEFVHGTHNILIMVINIIKLDGTGHRFDNDRIWILNISVSWTDLYPSSWEYQDREKVSRSLILRTIEKNLDIHTTICEMHLGIKTSTRLSSLVLPKQKSASIC